MPDANNNVIGVGDVVSLLVGGPDMVVLDICEDCGSVDVAWFDEASLEIASLPGYALVQVA